MQPALGGPDTSRDLSLLAWLMLCNAECRENSIHRN